MSDPASVVFSPIKVGDVTLSHRIALAPMTRQRANSRHAVREIGVEYYSQRACYAGTLLITEATFVSLRAGGRANAPGIFTPEQVDGWRNIVEAVHAKGCYVFLQIRANGRAAVLPELKSDDPSFEVVSSSDLPFEGGETPRALTVQEIDEYVKDFANASKAFVEECGGDGVEIHGANGYLVDQFLQSTCNKRTDEYGGGVEARARFGLECVKAVVDAIGESKTAIRLSPFSTFQGMKMDSGDLNATFTHFVTQLACLHPNLAYLHLIEPRAAGNVDTQVQEGESLAPYAKIWSPRPLVLVGGYKPALAEAEAAVGQYPNTVIAYGRYFTSNPDLVAKIQYGAEIVKYERETFYAPLGDEGREGFTSFAATYGPEGKL